MTPRRHPSWPRPAWSLALAFTLLAGLALAGAACSSPGEAPAAEAAASETAASETADEAAQAGGEQGGEGDQGTEVGALKPDEATLKEKLGPMEYRVTQEDGTEPPFENAYWDNKQPGIYVDVVSGEPLFSSTDKYESGTGWPSFTRPLEPDNILRRSDHKLGYERTEVRSRGADSHLGHVFEDGPPPTGLRYCINSAALRFIPAEDLEEEGYGEYLPLFEGEGSQQARGDAAAGGEGS